MTYPSPSLPPDRFAQGEFQVGQVLNRTFSVLSRNLLPFCVVTAIAYLPNFLFEGGQATDMTPGERGTVLFVGIVVAIVLAALSEAIVLFGAFEDMRGRPVNLMESLKVGLGRFFPVIGVALLVALLTGLAAILLVIPAFFVVTILFVAMPVCIVERLGPVKSLGRSAELTKGNRWKIFGLWLLVTVVTLIGTALIGAISYVTGLAVGLVLKLVWGALAGAFNAIMVVVTYHDLRVAKEGVDTDRIASVFD
jgi:hypothetical protein